MNLQKSSVYVTCLWLFLLAGLVRLEGKSRGWSLSGEDTCRPSLKGSHYQVSCFDTKELSSVPAPVAISHCSAIASLVHEDQFTELSCSGANFQGYFAPSRWTVTKIKGDGGVDVTGAPNSILVEGANNALVMAGPGTTMRMQILIPADGFVSFGCKHVGGSNLFSGQFRTLVNGQPRECSRQEASKAFYHFFVQQGDLLSLELKSNGFSEMGLDEFQLITDATAVVQRNWTVTDDQGHSNSFTQFISIRKPSITDVIIPDAVTASPGADLDLIAPAATGFPFIDRDGQLQTTDDRLVLRDDQVCGFRVRYQDEVQEMPGGMIILRHWTISDPCDDNQLASTQIIRLFPEATGDGTEDHLSNPRSPLPAAPEIMSENRKQGSQGNDYDWMSY